MSNSSRYDSYKILICAMLRNLGFHTHNMGTYDRTDYMCQKGIDTLVGKKELTVYLQEYNTGEIQIQWEYQSKGTLNILTTNNVTLEPNKRYSTDDFDKLIEESLTKVTKYIDLHCTFRRLHIEKANNKV